MEENKKTLHEKIQERITAGDIQMKSKFFFWLQRVGYIAALVVALLGGIYAISFVWFMLRIRGAWELPFFGFAGVRPFIFAVPWLIVFVAIVCLFILEFVLKKKTIAYRTPIIVSILVIGVLALGSGYAFSRLPFHQKIFDTPSEQRPPVVGGLYRQFAEESLQNITFGVVRAVTEDAMLITSPDVELLSVTITNETHLQRGMIPNIGDRVMILGEIEEGVLEAIGIKIIPVDREYHRLRSIQPHNGARMMPPPMMQQP